MTETNVSGTLPNAYPQLTPQAPPAPVVDDKLAKEVESLKGTIKEMTDKAAELEKENGSLTKKLADIEREKLVALADKVADLKISRGLLTEDKKKDEVKTLSDLSAETLQVLDKELSNIKVKLTANPQPLSTPPADPTPPAAPTPEEKFDTDVKEMRMKLFGHESEPNEYYQKLRDEGGL